MEEKEEYWDDTKILLAIKILLIKEKNQDQLFYSLDFDTNRFYTQYLNPPSDSEPYWVFKSILDDFYPLGIKIEVVEKINIHEKEGINQSEITCIEFKKFLEKKIKQKENKVWNNILNQYFKLYNDKELDKLKFRFKISDKSFHLFKEKLQIYINKFRNNKLFRKGIDVTPISYQKQTNLLVEYINNRLKNGDNNTNFSFNEIDFVKWIIKNNKLSIDRLFSPHRNVPIKTYGFLEILLDLHFQKKIKIENVMIDSNNSKGILIMFSSVFDILHDVLVIEDKKIKIPYKREFWYENNIFYLKLISGSILVGDFSKSNILRKVFETFYRLYENNPNSEFSQEEIYDFYKKLFKDNEEIKGRIGKCVSNIKSKILKEIIERKKIQWFFDKNKKKWIFKILDFNNTPGE